MKHLRTEVEGSRKRRFTTRPKHPFERLKDCGQLAPEQFNQLEALSASLNPFDLKRCIKKKLPALLRAGNLGGAAFFDAGTVISTDGADGLHLTGEAQKKLGTAVAAKVREILK